MEERTLLQDSRTGRLLVGLFVAAAVAGFAWLLFVQHRGPERYLIVAEFDVLGNVDEATQVKLRGFTIGQVDRIEFRPVPPAGEAHFLVHLGIDKRYPVPRGVVAQIRGSGLVGEAAIELDASAEQPGILAPGSRVPGQADPGLKSVMDKVAGAAQKLGAAGKGIQEADLGGKLTRLGEDVSRIADDLERVSTSADSLLVTSRDMVSRVEPTLLRTLQRLDESMARLSLTLARTDTLVAGTSEDVRSSVRALRQVVERLDQVLQRVDTLVQHKESELDETLTNLHATSAAARQLGEHPWRLLTGPEQPPATIGEEP